MSLKELTPRADLLSYKKWTPRSYKLIGADVMIIPHLIFSIGQWLDGVKVVSYHDNPFFNKADPPMIDYSHRVKLHSAIHFPSAVALWRM